MVSKRSNKEEKKKFLGKRGLWAVFAIGFLALLALITVGIYRYQSRTIVNDLIVHNVSQLESIFKRINEECGIIGFEHERNYVDFLTVQSFVGSEVGAMNLKNPSKWHGPYVHDNPTVQEKLYEIIRTKKGYFLVPGAGIKLTNGQVIGKDIILDEDSDIFALVKDGVLTYQGQPLAVPVTTM